MHPPPLGRHRSPCIPTYVNFTLEKTKYFWEYYQWLHMSPTSKPHEVDVLLSCGVERVFNIGSSILPHHTMSFGMPLSSSWCLSG